MWNWVGLGYFGLLPGSSRTASAIHYSRGFSPAVYQAIPSPQLTSTFTSFIFFA